MLNLKSSIFKAGNVDLYFTSNCTCFSNLNEFTECQWAFNLILQMVNMFHILKNREIMFENQGWREKRYSNYLLIIVCNQRVEILFLHVYNMLHCSD